MNGQYCKYFAGFLSKNTEPNIKQKQTSFSSVKTKASNGAVTAVTVGLMP